MQTTRIISIMAATSIPDCFRWPNLDTSVFAGWNGRDNGVGGLDTYSLSVDYFFLLTNLSLLTSIIFIHTIVLFAPSIAYYKILNAFIPIDFYVAQHTLLHSEKIAFF